MNKEERKEKRIIHVEKRAGKIYFMKVELFEQRLAKIPRYLISINGKEWCKACPHQIDTHPMNCIECCPLSRRLELPELIA